MLAHHDAAEAGLFIGGSKEISEPSKVIDAVLLARSPRLRALTFLSVEGSGSAMPARVAGELRTRFGRMALFG